MGCLDCLFCWKNRGPQSPGPAARKTPSEADVAAVKAGLVSGAAKLKQQTETDGDANAPRRGKVTDFYTLNRVIGSGSYSVVREGVDKTTKTKYAIKVIKRAELTEEDDEAILTEVEILKAMDHPNIMTLREFFVEPEHYYLVTEFVSGGELFDRIVEKTFYSEKEARDLVQILVGAIKYCHDKDVVHRDLKPENLLLTSATDDASIKLADFGFAKKVEVDNAGLVTTCGTPGYVAPEILEGESYGKPVDIWSIGIITYILLAGYPPFHDDSQPILFRKIRKGKYQFDSPYWDNVSQDAKDFIGCMLVVDPTKRATAAELLEHKWLLGSDVANVPLTSALTELRRFHARKKFKAAVLSVQTTISLNRALGNSSASLAAKSTLSDSNSTVSV